MAIKYRKANEKYKHAATPAGLVKEAVMEKTYDDMGHPVLKMTGERNVQEEIDSYADLVSMDRIVEQYAANPSSIRVRNLQYGDAAMIPNSVDEARKKYDEYEANIKVAYSNFKGKEYISYADYKEALTKGNIEALQAAADKAKPKESEA